MSKNIRKKTNRSITAAIGCTYTSERENFFCVLPSQSRICVYVFFCFLIHPSFQPGMAQWLERQQLYPQAKSSDVVAAFFSRAPKFLLFASLTLTDRKRTLLVCILPPIVFCHTHKKQTKKKQHKTTGLTKTGQSTSIILYLYNCTLSLYQKLCGWNQET